MQLLQKFQMLTDAPEGKLCIKSRGGGVLSSVASEGQY